jgi:hypothetical protein
MRADAILCRLRSAHASAAVRGLSGALVDLAFTLGGRRVQPLAVPPWGAPPAFKGEPPAAHLTVLGGEWPCVPFGRSTTDAVKHGFGTDNFWRLDRSDARSAALSIDYPGDRPVARLERSITLSDEMPRVDLTLTIHARRAAILPIGLHPILALPGVIGGLRLRPAPHGRILTAPAHLAPATSRLVPDQTIGADGLVAMKDGGIRCLWDQPGPESEELVLIRDCDGWLEAENRAELYITRLTWDAATLPHLLFWIANPGLGKEPRLSGFRGLGAEPVAAYFDATGEAAEGVAITPEQPLTIRYAIDCHPLRPEEDQT